MLTRKVLTTGAAQDNRRRGYGPVPVAALLPGLTRAAFRRHGSRDHRIAADWEAIVGPALAAVTVPRQLAAGTLTLGCSGPIALELQHLADQLMARINMHLGGAPVQRLRFVQLPPAPQAAPPRRPRRSRPKRRRAWKPGSRGFPASCTRTRRTRHGVAAVAPGRSLLTGGLARHGQSRHAAVISRVGRIRAVPG